VPTDFLAHGLELIDNSDGKAVKKLPREEWVPVEEALENFLQKVEKLDGAPLTICYKPHVVHPLPKPEPRTIEELVEYVDTTQHVDLDLLAKQPDQVQKAVHQAWHALARNPYLEETDKRVMMHKIMDWLLEAKDQNLLERLMQLPKNDDPYDYSDLDVPEFADWDKKKY